MNMLELRSDRDAEAGKNDGRHYHKNQSKRQCEPIYGAKPCDQTDDENEQALERCDGRSAERFADHHGDSRHRGDECFFQKSELTIPQKSDTRKNGRKEHRHSDHTGSDELKIAAVTRLLKDWPEAETEHEQIQQRLAQRCDYHRPRTRVSL